MEKPNYKDYISDYPSDWGLERIMKHNNELTMYSYALEEYIKFIEAKCDGNPVETSENSLHKHIVMQRSELFCECSTDHGRYFDALTTTMRCNHCELRVK